MTSVFIVDDHRLFLAGVRAELEGRVELVGEAGDVDSAIQGIRASKPDVVLLDVHMPGGGGKAVIEGVVETHPDVKFLALSVSDAAEDVISLIRSGARGYVTKTIAPDALVSGVDEWPTRERVERFGEFVEMVSRLTSGESDSYGGRHYRSDRFARGPWPVQPRIPLTIAAHGMKTLRIAARHADTWNVSAGFGRNFDDLIGFLHENNARLDEFAAAAGREPGSIRRSLLIGASGAFEWWKSAGALDEFVGRVGDAGTRYLVFAYPPPAGVDKSTFLE